ncbi:MAG: IS91 family transposase [Gammaproteobacteria bacterium]|nr:MAG: IS91 family transposase [Gammaproteobacteria bacterium]
MPAVVCCAPARSEHRKSHLKVADIFRDHGEAYTDKYPLTIGQRRVMHDIEICRTSVLGGHLDVCDKCGHEQPFFDSCRNRHCPTCQSLDQARWIQSRKDRVLPTKHFHVVFTLPSTIRNLAMQNRRLVFKILFRTAASTLLKFGSDSKWLGGQLGITAVLHTWSRSLMFHPHLHCIVTDGGLSPDDTRWIEGKGKARFLFPVHAVATVFRAKFVDALRRARKLGKLCFKGACANLADSNAFARFCDGLFGHKWVVYAKRPFGSVDNVFDYLGRYTHRVGISNHRLISYDDNGVCFSTKDGKTKTLQPIEFIRRFLLHVLPKGFTKIRHFGLMAPANVNTKLGIAHQLLAFENAVRQDGMSENQVVTPEAWSELLQKLTGIDPGLCPKCRLGRMVSHPLPRKPP